MLDGVLSSDQLEVLKLERRLLADVGAELTTLGESPETREALASSVEQLDELFLVVVVGEFNAGKSSLLNALIGEVVLAEGVTPTTSQIHVVRWADQAAREVLEEGVERIGLPVPLLKQVTLVDTPGTNALERRHEKLTDEFVPRSDLVLFVTSSDRPFSESERLFLERVRDWGKKVVVIVNKIDILRGEGAVGEVVSYIEDHSQSLLGMVPRIFPVSAVAALAARTASDDDALDASGLPALEKYLREVLDRGERVRLKLGNPVGVAENLLSRSLQAVGERTAVLEEDVTTLDTIDRQMATYTDDVRREFDLRLAEMDSILHGLELRGIDFFDESLRLGRLPQLFDADRLRAEFEKQVVADIPAEIETKVESLIDWLVASDLNQWQAVVQHVGKRQSMHADRVVGEVNTRFDYDRANLLETVGRAARDGLSSYDRVAEARDMAEGVKKSVAGTALVEAGAVGIGATVALLATSTAVDVTGLTAAGLLAAFGLFILPNRRRKAKANLREKVASLRQRIMDGLTRQFEKEADKSVGRIQETIAPYSRFVRSESELLEQQKGRVAALLGRLTELREKIIEATRQD